MVSFWGQKKVGPRQDWSPLGVNLKFPTSIPAPFIWESPLGAHLYPYFPWVPLSLPLSPAAGILASPGFALFDLSTNSAEVCCRVRKGRAR